MKSPHFSTPAPDSTAPSVHPRPGHSLKIVWWAGAWRHARRFDTHAGHTSGTGRRGARGRYLLFPLPGAGQAPERLADLNTSILARARNRGRAFSAALSFPRGRTPAFAGVRGARSGPAPRLWRGPVRAPAPAASRAHRPRLQCRARRFDAHARASSTGRRGTLGRYFSPWPPPEAPQRSPDRRESRFWRAGGSGRLSARRSAVAWRRAMPRIAWRTPPRQYGAWETVAGNITEGLVSRGWDVTLFATRDSVTEHTCMLW